MRTNDARPEAGAVVHLHSTQATAIACPRDIDMNDAEELAGGGCGKRDRPT